MLSSAILISALFIVLCIVSYSLRHKGRLAERREKQVQESREQLSATIKFAPDAVIVVNCEGAICEWNDAAQACFGFSRGEMIGQNLSELICIPHNGESGATELHADVLHLLKNANATKVEMLAIEKNGSRIPVETTFGRTRGMESSQIIIFLRDISERKQAENKLQMALQNAEQASMSKANFLAVMSHEMRTPLNGIIGAIDLLSDSKLDINQSKLVGTARNAGNELLSQICDVLDFSKLEAKKVVLEPVTCSLLKIIKDVADILQNYLPDHNNEIRICIDESFPSHVLADEQRIKQVLLNLGSNALKFTKNGVVEFQVKQEPSGSFVFSVTDTGLGIAQSDLKFLFKEFSMLDSSLRRNTGGTGLGLAICARLVEAMNGEVGVDSKINVGSTFWFRLKLDIVEVQDQPKEFGFSEARQVAGVNILVVEDNSTNQFIIREMLSNLGCLVSIAGNGKVAVEATSRYKFDIVLMDISMPVMDGLEAIQLIRKQLPYGPKLPIIALTANAVAGDKEKFLVSGFTGFLAKPVRKTELAQAISSSLMLDNSDSQSPQSDLDCSTNAEESLIDRRIYESLVGDIGAGLMPDIISRMRDELDAKFSILAAQAGIQNLRGLTKTAHAISGLASTIGAVQLSNLAKQMERSGNSLSLFELKAQIQVMSELSSNSFAELSKVV